MTQGLHPLAANMVNQLNRVDVISNNLANANTAGFKQDNLVEGSFNHYLDKAREQDKGTLKLSEVMNTVPKIDGGFMKTEVGSIRVTNNRFDLALKNEATFFKVLNKNNEIEYTRDGQFKLLDGELVTQNGYNVLNDQNEPVLVGDDDIFTQNVAVVSTSFKNLDKVGNNNYKAYDSSKVIQAQDRGLVQGAVEESNVNTIKTMVGLIQAQRKFEQAQKAMTGIDEINKKVIDTIGNNR